MACVQINTQVSANGVSRVQFRNCSFLGGLRGVWLLGSAYIFDVQVLGCHFQQWNAVNQGIGYDQSDAATAPNGGISTVIRDCTFRNHSQFHIYCGAPAGNVVVENCTLESCVGPSIRWAGTSVVDTAGHLTLINNHWEGIEQGATFVGGRMQSSVTGVVAAVIYVDRGITQLNIFGPDAQLSGSATPANAISFVATDPSYNGEVNVLVLGGLILPTVAPTMGQPYFRFDRLSAAGTVRYVIEGTRFGAVSGAGALTASAAGTLVGDYMLTGIAALTSIRHADSLRLLGIGGTIGGHLGYQSSGGLARLLVGDGTVQQGVDLNAWRTTWTPAITQSGARTSTPNWARYQIVGRLVTVTARIAITQAGVAGNAIVCDLPQTPALTSGNGTVIGSFNYLPAAGNNYAGVVVYVPTVGCTFMINQAGAGSAGLGHLPSLATANGDVLMFTVSYEF
jgi:hypothetical protein